MKFNPPKNLFPATIENQEQGVANMKSETKHTPIPWKSNGLRPEEGDFHFACAIWSDDGEIPICSTRFSVGRYNEVDEQTQNANCKFIELAVNSHAALTSALDQCVKALETLLTEPWILDDSRPKHWAHEQARAALETAKKARQ